MTNNNEIQIHQIIDARVEAIHNKNINELLSNHSKDIQTFDVFKPMQYIGVENVKERAEKWFSSYKSSIGYEVEDLSITADDNVAFCHYIYHVTGTLLEGNEVDMHVRSTIGLKKIDDKWKIIHEHNSVPLSIS